MNKAQKLQAAADLADSILDADVSDDVVEAVAKVAAKAPKAPRAPKAEKAEGEIGLTAREILVIKAVANSEFADKDGSVPSFTLAINSDVPVGDKKVNSPIPGIVASLNKKGVFNTIKVKGQTMISLSVIGKEYLDSMA